MSTAMRVIWLFALSCFLGGCTAYKVMAPGRVGGDASATMESESPVKKGDRVRITQQDGYRASGKVVAASAREIVLDTGGNDEHFATVGDGAEGAPIAPTAIRTIEKRCFSLGRTLGLVGAIALPLVVIGAGMESVDFSMDGADWGMAP